jgi:ABC-type branched-subunit amino acid transport system substrate-binding protein
MTLTSRRPLIGLTAIIAGCALALTACGGTTRGDAGGSGGGDLGSAPGFDASTGTFTVTALEPLSGSISSAGLALANGMKVYFDDLNAKGGIAGKYKVNFEPEDTQFNPQVAVPLYNRTKTDTVMYAGILGTTIVKTLEPQLTADNIVSVIDSSSSDYIHSPNLLSWGTPTQINVINLMAYAVDELGQKSATFCSITSGDDLGAENREGVEFGVGKLGVKFGVNVTVNQGETNFVPQVQQLQSAGCQVVVLGATTAQVPGIVAAATQLNFTAQYLGQNNVYDPSFATSPIAAYLQQHLLTTLMGLGWESDAPGQVAFREAIAKTGVDVKPSPFAQLGYAHAMFVAAVLEKAVQSGDVSRDAIVRASRTLGDFDYQGMLPTFGYHAPADRKPALSTGIYKVDPAVPMGVTAVDPAYRSPVVDAYPIVS